MPDGDKVDAMCRIWILREIPTRMYFTTVVLRETKQLRYFFVVINTIVSLGMECPREGEGEEGKRRQRVLRRGLNVGAFCPLPGAVSCPAGEARETIWRWDTTEVRHPSRKVAYLMNPRRRYERVAWALRAGEAAYRASTGVVRVSRAKETSR